MLYFFFDHPLNAEAPRPGRYPMDCIGSLVNHTGEVQHDAAFTIFADGLALNKLGANVDPCPFASPLGIIHSFCRLDKKGGKFWVISNNNSTKRNLAQFVRPGDVIFYGHLQTHLGEPEKLYVDTVVVVERTLDLPTKLARNSIKPYRFDTGPTLIASLFGSNPNLNTEELSKILRDSDLWRTNLQDVLPNRGHEYTAFQPHKIIVGKVAAKGSEKEELKTRITSYVPLITNLVAGPSFTINTTPSPPTLTRSNAQCHLWSDLTEWVNRNPRMAKGLKPPTIMSASLGEAIYDQIRQQSGTGTPFQGCVAMPPVIKSI